MEQWKDIEGYEGYYQVSDLGNVKSLERITKGKVGTRLGRRLIRERILKPGTSEKGYLYINLCKESKLKGSKVHRLVATAFHPNPDDKPEVDHKNENKTDNRSSNLRWVTHSENIEYAVASGAHNFKGERHHKSILTEEQAIEVIKLLQTSSISGAQIGINYGLHGSSISQINIGYTWKHLLPNIERPIRKR